MLSKAFFYYFYFNQVHALGLKLWCVRKLCITALNSRFRSKRFQVQDHFISFDLLLYSVLPRPFQYSGPTCLHYPHFFGVVNITIMIDVVISSTQNMPTHSGLKFSWGEPCCIHLMVGGLRCG